MQKEFAWRMYIHQVENSTVEEQLFINNELPYRWYVNNHTKGGFIWKIHFTVVNVKNCNKPKL